MLKTCKYGGLEVLAYGKYDGTELSKYGKDGGIWKC
jgi:hypothetical protein